MMSKIVPHLWFDREGKEAARFYTSLFPDSSITHESVLKDTPSGECDIVSFKLWGHEFQAISAGPYCKFNGSTSFVLNFELGRDPNALAMLDEVWAKFAEGGGKVLVPLDAFPFSKRYGWIQDKFGLSWQLILSEPMEGVEMRPTIYPALLFVKDKAGQAEAAMQHYLTIFPNSKNGHLSRWPADHPKEREGSVMYADFKIEDAWFSVSDSTDPAHDDLHFNEAVSFLINCDSQEEIDTFWGKLSAVKEAEQCGWVKDRFGVSWQIVPREMEDMMRTGTPEQVSRVTKAFLEMKKFEIEPLRAAFALVPKSNEHNNDAERSSKQMKLQEA